MADWNSPSLTTAYTTVLTDLKGRDVDAMTLGKATPTNPPDGAIRYNRSTNLFEEYATATGLWTAKVLSLAGGGTGATSAAAVRTALGLGDMALQNGNAVAITGGSIVASTHFGLTTHIVLGAHNTYDLGTKTVMPRNIFAASGAVAPVGADKWVVA